WLHLWRPYCSSEYCRNIDYFTDIEKKYMLKDFKFFLISETYDVKDIIEKMKNVTYDKPILVLMDSYYGHSMRKNNIKLLDELDNKLSLERKYGYFDYLFKDTILIYAGRKITEKILDSLIVN
ncbi:hypothetical protein ACFLRZ_05745, partial [Bacteroidota bacterium]